MKEFLNDSSYLFDGAAVINSTGPIPMDIMYPTLEDLLSRLKDPEYLNYSYFGGVIMKTQRKWYLEALSKRPELTETQKRLVKMHLTK
jgi:hypothetical protein